MRSVSWALLLVLGRNALGDGPAKISYTTLVQWQQGEGAARHKALLDKLDSENAGKDMVSFAEWTKLEGLTKEALEANEKFFEGMDNWILTVFNQSGITTTSDAEATAIVLTSIVRHWTAQGAKLRQGTVGRIIGAVQSYPMATRWRDSKIRVLVPGAGLGRIAFEVASIDPKLSVAAVEAHNPSARFILYLLNHRNKDAALTEYHTVYPAAHVMNNWKLPMHRYLAVRFPDVSVQSKKFNLALGMGTFPEKLGNKAADVVVTSFFLDAGDPIATIHNIKKVLDMSRAESFAEMCADGNPGGEEEGKICAVGGKPVYWINDGPLVYPYSTFGMIQLSYEQVRRVMVSEGFRFLEESTNKCSFEYLEGQLEGRDLTCFFFVAELG